MGLGSGIRKKPIPDPGSRVNKAPDPGSGSATLNNKIVSFILFFLDAGPYPSFHFDAFLDPDF